MRLAPLFNSAGQLLGHIDLNRCLMSRDSYSIDEHVGRIGAWTQVPGAKVKDTVRFFRFPLKHMRFHWDQDESIVRYMVVDDHIPEWVWNAGGIQFNGAKDWEK